MPVNTNGLVDVAPAFPIEKPECPLDFRKGKWMLIPYRRLPIRDDSAEFPLHEVVVGPSPNMEQSYRSGQSLLRSQGLPDEIVKKSEIPYRNW